MSNFRPQNFPPMPKIPNNDFLQRAVTTRVMAAKQVMQLHKEENELCYKGSSTPVPHRRNSKFLSGASIPNSTIRSTIDQTSSKTETFNDINSSDLTEISDTLNLGSNTDRDSSEERGLERMRQKIRGLNLRKELLAKPKDKERRRSSLISNLEMPKKQRRLSTLESIKTAIEQTPDSTIKLVNADSIEKRNLGQNFKVLSPSFEPVSKTVLDNNIPSTSNNSEKTTVQKQDLQTQTSLVLEKLLAEMARNRSTSKSN